MTKRSPERVEFLSDVFVTAIEGGINYWGSVMEYDWDVTPADSFRAVVSEIYDDANAEHVIDINTIASGVRKIVAGRVSVASWIENCVHDSDRHNDAGGVNSPGIDSWVADAIVQAGLFGEIVYG